MRGSYGLCCWHTYDRCRTPLLAAKARQVFVPMIVQVETVWVLESGYGLPKEKIAHALEHLESNQAFLLENEELEAEDYNPVEGW